MGKMGCKQIKNHIFPTNTEFNRRIFVSGFHYIMRRIFGSSLNSYHNTLETKQFMHIELDMNFLAAICAMLL